MKTSNFVPEVKEREEDQPCFVLLNLDNEIGLPHGQALTFNLPAGTDITAAEELARALKASGATLKLG